MRKRPIEFFAFLYIIVWTVSPPLQLGMIYRVAALGCAVFLFIHNRFARTTAHDAAILFCGLAAVSAILQSGKLSSALTPIAIYMLFIGYILNYWYEYEWEEFADIVPITLLVLAVWNFRTFQALLENPMIARMVVRNDEVANYFLRNGVGGYALLYSQVIVFPAIVQWILSARRYNRTYFACGVVWAVTFVAFLFNAGYTIAIVDCIISLVVLFSYRQKEILPAILISGVILLLSVYLIAYVAPVRNFLLSVFEGTKVANKIMDVSMSVTTDETADSIVSRAIRYGASLRTIFVDYPVIGGLWRGGAGGHSAILDAFAQYGLFGGVIMFQMIYCVTNMWKQYNISEKMMRVVNATIISVSFVAWLDSMPYNFVMMMTVVLPIILCTIADWSIKNDENIMDSEPDSD